jgi:hypothetical protein
MASNSRIGKMLPDGTIKQIYCHWDGYVEGGVGETLAEHYNTDENIDALLELGDLSQLAQNLNPTGEHSFDKPQAYVCVAYGRDRGEDSSEVKAEVVTLDEWMKPFYSTMADFYYLYNAGNWLVLDFANEEQGWKLVKEFLPVYSLTNEDFASIITK